MAFKMKGSPYPKKSPMYKNDPKTKTVRDVKMEEGSNEEKAILAQIDKLEIEMAGVDKNSTKYKNLKDQILDLQNKLNPFD